MDDSFDELRDGCLLRSLGAVKFNCVRGTENQLPHFPRWRKRKFYGWLNLVIGFGYPISPDD